MAQLSQPVNTSIVRAASTMPDFLDAPLDAGGEVRSRVADGVATVLFGHPKGNSLPATVLRALAAEIEAVGANPGARVIVLRSFGDGPFCAGASFDELVAVRDAAGGKEFFMGFVRVILAMIRAPKPVVTRVHGKVVGGGVGIVAASDYAIATEKSSLRLSELAVGIGPFIVGVPIQRKVGPGPFAGMAMDADWRDATWAERHGLYTQVAAGLGALDARMDSLVAMLASSNPEALTRIKAVMWEGTDDWARLMEERAAMSGELVLSEFTRDAILRFKAG